MIFKTCENLRSRREKEQEMIEAVFVDFDGVIRHWRGDDITQMESSINVPGGTLFSFAFEKRLLQQVITGKISHENWIHQVLTNITDAFDEEIARSLVDAWRGASFRIAYGFLASIREVTPTCKLVLVTNATSRLAHDLEASNLVGAFDVVVNSSEIGVAKPNSGFYLKALALADANAYNSIFIDDSAKNVAKAIELGFKGLHHKENQETLNFIAEECH